MTSPTFDAGAGRTSVAGHGAPAAHGPRHCSRQHPESHNAPRALEPLT